jgi:ATP-dependent DNA helicase RecQ
VQHTEWGGGTVMNTDTDRLTVLFDEHGYRTLSADAVTSNNILVPE